MYYGNHTYIEKEILENEVKRRKGLEEKVHLLEGKVRFLRAYEPGPLSAEFQGDISFVGSDQKRVCAHLFIMAAKSTVIQRMFQNDMREKRSRIITVDDASSPVVRSMVNFCYTADIHFTEEASAEQVLKVAHKYDIKALRDLCGEELCKGLNTDNLCKRLVLARMYDSNKLGDFTAKYFKDNFNEVYPSFVERLCKYLPLDAE
ncbi:hypothetical protein R1flu_023051 [Riccia fluitans]|uniref:BTB domain-containing protein n=1 Tax=Riccia fluitans TaxID=41844 RepID=A0ABD1XQZ1_9MARC